MTATTHPTSKVGIRRALAVVTVAGLLVDAYVHFHLAKDYDLNKTSVLSQGQLFRAEGVVAILAAVAVIARPRRYTNVIAAAVAGSAFVVLLAYRYVNIKAIGPVPSMYEPIWFTEKTVSGVAEFVSFLAASTLVAIGLRTS